MSKVVNKIRTREDQRKALRLAQELKWREVNGQCAACGSSKGPSRVQSGKSLCPTCDRKTTNFMNHGIFR